MTTLQPVTHDVCVSRALRAQDSVTRADCLAPPDMTSRCVLAATDSQLLPFHTNYSIIKRWLKVIDKRLT